MENTVRDSTGGELAAQRNEIRLFGNGSKNEIRLNGFDEIATGCDAGVTSLNGLMDERNVEADDNINVFRNLQHGGLQGKAEYSDCFLNGRADCLRNQGAASSKGRGNAIWLAP
jgi:hypothetical protein